MATYEFDAIVIGSGVSGGWAAKELCEKGMKVLMLERGRMVEHRKDYITEGRGPWQLPYRGTLPPAEVSKLAFYNSAFRPDPAALTEEQRAGMVANQQTLAVYAGQDFMFAPKLRRRLHRVTVPVLVAWGEEDGVVSADYGRAYAAAFPNGHFTPIAEAGHFPQIEQLGAVLGAIGDFVDNVIKPDGD